MLKIVSNLETVNLRSQLAPKQVINVTFPRQTASNKEEKDHKLSRITIEIAACMLQRSNN